MPRVSVIVPAFNAERYLSETLASVEAQTYRDWEVVVADDASTDGTVGIVERFGGRFTILGASTNAGPATARNRAIEASTGELLAFLDADDLWLPDYLRCQVDAYDESSTESKPVGIVACDARILGPEGYRRKTYMQVVQFPKEVTLTRLLVSNPIYVSVVSPRVVVEEAGCFSPLIFGTEDYDLWLRIVERGYRVVVNRSPLAIYRLSAGSVSGMHVRGAASLRSTYGRALERGKLTWRQRRIARRNIRFSRALEHRASIAAKRQTGSLRYGDVARALPLLLIVKLEHPNQWFDSIRHLLGHPTSTSALERLDG